MTHRTASSVLATLAIYLLTAGCATPGDPTDPTTDPPGASSDRSDLSREREHGCTSKVNASGLVCTTCGEGRRAQTECMAAQCNVSDHCMRCVDPKGRVARDCSIDFEKVRTGSFGGPPDNAFSFASCSFGFGAPAFSGTTCQYPGQDTCKLTDDEGGHCLTCTYSDGSGSGICGDAGDPFPDPQADRPDDLPRPGTCITERGADGQISCTACTRRDRSATRSCHIPGVVSCDFFTEDQTGCHRCTLVDGSQALLCGSGRGPHLVPLP
jgi:hypothetical protein